MTANTASTLQITLTAQQQSDFTACAKTCGLDLDTWIVQCAAVQAAAVIDAVQATERKLRPKEFTTNESTNVRNRKRRQARARTAKAAPAAESTTLTAAKAYNDRFRRSKTP